MVQITGNEHDSVEIERYYDGSLRYGDAINRAVDEFLSEYDVVENRPKKIEATIRGSGEWGVVVKAPTRVSAEDA